MSFADPINSTIYHRLEQEKEIRLIKLLPGSPVHKICCELFTVSLQDPSRPQYEALSYVWGNPAETLTIKVNRRDFNVTTNLHSAIHHLRQKDSERILWIDAMSINQSDTKEQNQQVHIMAEIYTCAHDVIIWLGSQTNYSERALELLEIIARSGHGAESPIWKNDATGDFLSDSELVQVFKPLQELGKNSWFTRIWAVQEAAVVPTTTLQFGHKTVQWHVLEDAIRWMKKHEVCCSYIITGTPNTYEVFRNIYQAAYRHVDIRSGFLNKRQRPFEWFLGVLRNMKASDDRDRVYGLLAFAQDLSIVPDYSLSSAQVYRNATFSIISQSGSLYVLAQASLTHRRLEVPTWVPDWATYNEWAFASRMGNETYPGIGLFSASGDRKAVCQYLGDDVLSLSGLLVDVVSEARTREDGLALNRAFLGAALRDIEVFLEKSSRFKDLADAVDHNQHKCRILLNDIILDESTQEYRRLKPNDFQTFSNWLKKSQVWHESFTKGDLHSFAPGRGMSQDMYSVTMTAAHTQGRRALFFTRDQRIGVGPSEIQPGDLVCVLFGGSTPFILRPLVQAIDSSNQYYSLVGLAYVNGLMDGEAIGEYEAGERQSTEFLLK
jgi:hypothetical protein